MLTPPSDLHVVLHSLEEAGLVVESGDIIPPALWPTWARPPSGPTAASAPSVSPMFVIDCDGIVRYCHRAGAGLTFKKTDELVAAATATL